MTHFTLLLLAATVALSSAAPEALSRLKRQDEAPEGGTSEMPPSAGGTSGEEGEAEGREVPSEVDWPFVMHSWGMPGMKPPQDEEMPADWIDAMVKLLLVDGGMGPAGHPGHGGRRHPMPMMPEVAYNFFTVTNNTVNIMVPGMMP